METKKYEKLKNGDLRVTVDTKAEVILPTKEKQLKIGKYTQKTIQVIEKKNVKVLSNFMRNQIDTTKIQVEELNQILEKLKDVNIELIPEDILMDITEIRKNMKGKSSSKHLKNLDIYLGALMKKKQTIMQKEYLDKQLTQMNLDFKQIDGFINKKDN